MASLDSYIKERDEKVKSGSLVYSGRASADQIRRVDFSRLNANTYKQNNGIYPEKWRY